MRLYLFCSDRSRRHGLGFEIRYEGIPCSGRGRPFIESLNYAADVRQGIKVVCVQFVELFLFIAQGDDWIDANCSASRNIAGCYR